MLADVLGKKLKGLTAAREDVVEAKFTETMETNRKSPSVAVLSEDVEFKGVLSFTNQLEINGRFEGEIKADGPLVIGETAVVKAAINSEANVVIRGKVQGNVRAKEKVEVAGHAQLFGDVTAPKFSLSETAVFVGKSDTLGGKSPAGDFANIFNRLDKAAKPAATSAPNANQ